MPGYAEPLCYERFPGAAELQLSASYRPRQPQETVLHQVVRKHLLSFLADGEARSESGEGYPYYVEKELRAFIGCGDLSRGFARIRCSACGFERLLPFSCKNRGICPSCTARRMSDEAAYLVDMVLPESSYRLWTLTFPWPIRPLMARDHRLITALLQLVVRALFAYQRKQAKKLGIPTGQAKTAAVVFVQRYGAALNSNVHLHALLPDAVFVQGEGETLELTALPAPTDEQVGHLLRKIARRVTAHVQKAFATLDEAQDVLGGAIYEAMVQLSSGILPLPGDDEDQSAKPARKSRRCAQLDGFSLHGDTSASAESRIGLEKLCRYGLRPAFSVNRLSISDQGKVLYTLRKPWPRPGGVTVLSFEPMTFLRRLVPLIPPPYANLVRHFGLFAPNAKLRNRLPAAPGGALDVRLEVQARLDATELSTPAKHAMLAKHAMQEASRDGETGQAAEQSSALTPEGKLPPLFPTHAVPEPRSPSSSAAAADDPVEKSLGERQRRKSVPWADLLRRVFAVDALRCPRCSCLMVVLSYLTDPRVVTKVLTHLSLPTSSPPLTPATVDWQLELFDEEEPLPHLAGRSRSEPSHWRSPPDELNSRAPPRAGEHEHWTDR